MTQMSEAAWLQRIEDAYAPGGGILPYYLNVRAMRVGAPPVHPNVRDGVLEYVLNEWLDAYGDDSFDGAEEMAMHIDNALDGAIRDLGRVQYAMENIARAPEPPPYAATSWAPEDVLVKRPDWTHERAEAWLKANGSKMADRLVELGWDVMGDLLSFADDEEGHGDEPEDADEA